MSGKVKMLFVCGAGLGSSFAAQMATEDVLNKYHVNAHLDHVDISTAASMSPDIIITAENFRKQFEKFNIVSGSEIEEKVIPILKAKGFIH